MVQDILEYEAKKSHTSTEDKLMANQIDIDASPKIMASDQIPLNQASHEEVILNQEGSLGGP